jgi:hypothetical protein
MALLPCLLLSSQHSPAQYVEVSARIEGTSWPYSPSGEKTEHRRSYTTRCIFGTNLWCIEDDFPLNAKRTWWCTGTNIIGDTLITKDTPERAVPDPLGPPPRLGERHTAVYGPTSSQPLDGTANLTWLAFCSGAFLKVEGRRLTPPFPAPSASDHTQLLDGPPGLPKRVEIYSPEKELVCVYEVRQSTNFLAWTIPLQFEFTQYRARGHESPSPAFHAVATVTSIQRGTEPRVPPDVMENAHKE